MPQSKTETNGRKVITDPVIQVDSDFDTYTNGELEALEDALGGNLYALTERGKPLPHKVMTGLLWLTMRRANPDATLDDARALKGTAWAVLRPPDPLPDSGARSEQTAPPPSAPSIG